MVNCPNYSAPQCLAWENIHRTGHTGEHKGIIVNGSSGKVGAGVTNRLVHIRRALIGGNLINLTHQQETLPPLVV